MKNITTLLFLFCCTISAYSQEKEFPTYRNGLIYSERTMGKLSHIVDSLNLKYKTCNFNTTFYSKSQALGHLIEVDSSSIAEALKDLEKGITYEEFVTKYPKSVVKENVLFTKGKYKDYRQRDLVSIDEVDLKNENGFSYYTYDMSLYDYDISDSWLDDYSEKTEYSKESLTIVFFPQNFTSAPIPKQYSALIGYSDCLIDTTTAKLKNKLKEGKPWIPKNWKSLPINQKVQLLDKLRSTRVVGECSMDFAPRVHAINIALLAADTYNWGVFLKAHLDVMNDQFERMSDGSYAWETRATYIKELEALNIDVPNLVIGMSFQIENPASNHYFGRAGRVGRAIAESKNRPEIEQAILSIIADKELDMYNRLLFYSLFYSYNYYLPNKAVQKENASRLAKVSSTLPDYVRARLVEK
jgi:hypothetical protein